MSEPTVSPEIVEALHEAYVQANPKIEEVLKEMINKGATKKDIMAHVAAVAPKNSLTYNATECEVDYLIVHKTGK